MAARTENSTKILGFKNSKSEGLYDRHFLHLAAGIHPSLCKHPTILQPGEETDQHKVDISGRQRSALDASSCSWGKRCCEGFLEEACLNWVLRDE